MAAITFSGFNNIDFNQVVTAIMAQERQPLTSLETQKTTLQTQNTAFGSLATKLTAMQSALESLNRDTSLNGLTAASSDSSVGVSAGNGSVEGSYDVVVNSIARRQVTASIGTYSSVDAVVATGGALTLTGADGQSKSVSVEPVMTVSELVDAINAIADAPVTASLVQSAPGAYQIVLTGRHTGASNAFTVSNNFTGGAGLTFRDGDGDGISGDSPADNVQNATNAEFTVNKLPVVSASNVVNDVVPGATLTLTREDPGKTATVTVARDSSKPKERIGALVTAYNDLVAFIGDQRTAASTGKANIARDPLVQQLKNSLRTELLGEHPNDGAFNHLAQVGLGFDKSGKMVLDDSTFDAAVSRGTRDLQKLFSGNDGKSGAFGAVESLMRGYTKSGGLVADVRQRLNTQMQGLAGRIDSFEALLEQRRLTLQREFQAADAMMSQLNSQQSSLSSLSNQYRLF
jgi:flagellar hook-associated protein 2